MPAVTDAPASAALPPHVRAWRYLKGGVVFLVVVFHLAVLAVRNPLDLWYKPLRDWMEKNPEGAERSYWDRYGRDDRSPLRLADNFTWKYTNLVGMEQRWVMFGPPLARSAPFLAVRIEFTDGTTQTLLSPNEPDDPTSFLRVGGWQVRKLEDYLIWPPDDLAHDPELPVWEAYARYRLAQWRQARPGDPRKVERIVFVRRRVHLPEPSQSAADVNLPSESDILTFDAQGKLKP
jgi:hypothetical protein